MWERVAYGICIQHQSFDVAFAAEFKLIDFGRIGNAGYYDEALPFESLCHFATVRAWVTSQDQNGLESVFAI